MKDIIGDAVNLASLPVDYGQGIENFKILVGAVDEAYRVFLASKLFEIFLLPKVIIPPSATCPVAPSSDALPLH